MKKFYYRVCACALTLSLLFTALACQPTPEKDIVVNKNEGVLEDAIADSPVPPLSLTTQTHWSESFDAHRIPCVIDAEIVLPQMREFPVLSLNRSTISKEKINRMAQYFTQGNTGRRKTEATLEDLQLEWQQAQRGAYTFYDDGSYGWEPYEGQKEDIARLEQEMQNLQPAVFMPMEEDDDFVGDYTYAMPDGSSVQAELYHSSMYVLVNGNQHSMVQPESWIFLNGGMPGEDYGTTVEGITVRLEDAQNLALSLLTELGVAEEMGLAIVEPARIINYIAYEIQSVGYQFVFTRHVGDAQAMDLDGRDYGGGLIDFVWESEEAFSAHWDMERLTVYVDETGIREVDWCYPLSASELNPGVALLPFEEIQEQIKQMANVGVQESGYRLNKEGYSCYILIDKILLTYVMTPEKDSPGSQLFVPAWVIFHKWFLSTPTMTDAPMGEGIFALNAIDGSVIHTSKGYKS